MATAKMKPSVPDRTQHFVIVQVDDLQEEVLTATVDDAESLAQAVVDAAASRSTISSLAARTSVGMWRLVARRFAVPAGMTATVVRSPLPRTMSPTTRCRTASR